MSTVYPDLLMQVPLGFDSIQFPQGNEFSMARWQLGKKLFFEKRLSFDGSLSCGSCHKQEYAFGDNVEFSLGVENRIGVSNSPPLFNLAYHPYFTRAGGVPTLEMQILVPIQDHREFDFNIVEVVRILEQDSAYQHDAKEAYDREFDAFVLTRAIATFERSLISGNSRYDQYMRGDSDALTADEIEGMNLFFSDAIGCDNCHSGILFSNFTFQNNGAVIGSLDSGRIGISKRPEDRGLYKVPSLRNVEVSGPYMHNGSYYSLMDVVEQYSKGGGNHENQSHLVKELNLSESEKLRLVQFLTTLTDVQFLGNSKFEI